jgi:hypothetical protein
MLADDLPSNQKNPGGQGTNLRFPGRKFVEFQVLFPVSGEFRLIELNGSFQGGQPTGSRACNFLTQNVSGIAPRHSPHVWRHARRSAGTICARGSPRSMI